MRLPLVVVAVVLVLVCGTLWWVKFDHAPPQVEFQGEANVVGRNAAWDFVVRVSGWPGLRRITVELVSQGKRYPLFTEEQPSVGFIGSRIAERSLHVTSDLSALGVTEGPAQLEVSADTYAWHLIPPRLAPVAERPVTIDLTPPTVELLTTQHNMWLGGSAAAVFRVTPDTTAAGVQVGEYFFPAVNGYFADPNVKLVLFAVPQDLSTAARPQARANDAVGNTRLLDLPCLIHERRFPERTMALDDQFLQRKVPELLSKNGLPPEADLVKGYLRINGELRAQTEKRLREVTATSAPKPLWDGPFHRQSNSAPMSAFADRRTYTYGGQPIDHKTHLGYDLASVLRAPVEAAQNGTVVFAGDLGIYGGTVVIDHGLGVFSLYGHLSSITVQPGQQVRTGEHVGQSGETGLAGGDHLHFSVMLDGVHVDPREWWDPKWLKDHVNPALAMFPVAGAATPAGGAAAAER